LISKTKKRGRDARATSRRRFATLSRGISIGAILSRTGAIGHDNFADEAGSPA
jgi:hypothetical protein